MLVFASLATAQQPSGQATQPGAPLTVVTQLVNIVTSVVDGQGNFVGGLRDHNFRILDNGAPQPMVFFTGEDLPARVMVVMETSPAVYLIHNQHLVAAYALLDGLAADDQVALVAYDQSPREILKFTADKSTLLSALNGVQYTIGMGDLNFYDSISSALDWLGGPRERRALVILATGLDSSPAPHWGDLVNKLRREDVVIFSVALGGALRPNESPKKSKKNAPPESAADESFAKADDALRSLATVTGGRAYFPRSETDFVPIYREIASALRHQYVIGIVPAHDGLFHTLTVEPLDAKGQLMNAPQKKPVVRVFAREGYLAPGP